MGQEIPALEITSILRTPPVAQTLMGPLPTALEVVPLGAPRTPQIIMGHRTPLVMILTVLLAPNPEAMAVRTPQATTLTAPLAQRLEVMAIQTPRQTPTARTRTPAQTITAQKQTPVQTTTAQTRTLAMILTEMTRQARRTTALLAS